MQARYYDPVTGRFLANDPVGFSPQRPDMFNRYAYAGNDPVNMWDPDGKCSRNADGKMVGVCIQDLKSLVRMGKVASSGYDGIQRANEIATKNNVVIEVKTDSNQSGGRTVYSDNPLKIGKPSDSTIILGGKTGSDVPVENLATGETYSTPVALDEQVPHELGHGMDAAEGKRAALGLVDTSNSEIPATEKTAIEEENKYREAKGSNERRVAY